MYIIERDYLLSLADAPLVESIYDKSRALYARLQQSHENLSAILASMQRWSREPLHQRSLYGRNLLDLRHQQERVRLRLLQCDETRCLLNRLLIANFCLFFDYETQQFQLYSRDLSVQEVRERWPLCACLLLLVIICYYCRNCLLSTRQFVREFPDEQRRQFGKYLSKVDELICHEVRQAMRIRWSDC